MLAQNPFTHIYGPGKSYIKSGVSEAGSHKRLVKRGNASHMSKQDIKSVGMYNLKIQRK